MSPRFTLAVRTRVAAPADFGAQDAPVTPRVSPICPDTGLAHAYSPDSVSDSRSGAPLTRAVDDLVRSPG